MSAATNAVKVPALTLGFWIIKILCTTLGETGALPPLLAVWAPGIAFSFLSIYLFLGVRT